MLTDENVCQAARFMDSGHYEQAAVKKSSLSGRIEESCISETEQTAQNGSEKAVFKRKHKESHTPEAPAFPANVYLKERKYIMGTYYRHTRSEKAEVPYSFQCEHCGKNSGALRAVINGPEAEDNSNFKTLNEEREEKLCRRAHENLVREMKSIHKDAVEKKIFSTDFIDKCPHCSQPQSWAVSGLKKKMFENPIVCLGVGAVISLLAVLCHYFTDMEYVTLPLAAGIFAVSVAAAVVCLLWNMAKISAKTKKTSSGAKNLPVIEWGAVQGLLNE